MGKAVIGVIPLVDEAKESYWMLPGYMKGVEDAGGLPVMLPLTDDRAAIVQMAQMCDGFLLTGGQDVSPQIYGERPGALCGTPCDARDAMEKILLQEALRQDLAVLGICRGIQFINAALGGTLYQDLPAEHPSAVEHHQKPPYHLPIHEVRVVGDSPLHQLLNRDTLSVNSYHHQAVKKLAEPLTAMAYSEDDLVEAVYMKSQRFVWAVQWHPEFSYTTDSSSREIFRQFVKQAECGGHDRG